MDERAEAIALDDEWVMLMKEAKVQGLTIEEVRLFLTRVEEAAN